MNHHFPIASAQRNFLASAWSAAIPFIAVAAAWGGAHKLGSEPAAAVVQASFAGGTSALPGCLRATPMF